MPAIGPSAPKRKRSTDGDDSPAPRSIGPSVGPSSPPDSKRRRSSTASDSDGSDFGPAVGPIRPPAGPARPPNGTKEEGRSLEVEASKAESKVVNRIGPTLPPHLMRGRDGAKNDVAAAFATKPLQGPDGDVDISGAPRADASDSDSDDDYGPMLPGSSKSAPRPIAPTAPISSSTPQPAQRDDWMLAPPASGDWTSRVDPTKLRARKFNTGKGAKAPAAGGRSDGPDSTWLETPEEKRKRLEDEVMGRKRPAASGGAIGPERPGGERSREDEAARRKIREYNEKYRSQSLYASHQEQRNAAGKEPDDDPSARPFDREKDIAGGRTINQTQRKEMLKRTGGLGDRFASGKFL